MLTHALLLAVPAAALAALAQAPVLPASKFAVEAPLERALATGALPPQPARVAPGLVRWHADFAAAQAAAVDSGKPVLLFQLLGRLDDELC